MEPGEGDFDAGEYKQVPCFPELEGVGDGYDVVVGDGDDMVAGFLADFEESGYGEVAV